MAVLDRSEVNPHGISVRVFVLATQLCCPVCGHTSNATAWGRRDSDPTRLGVIQDPRHRLRVVAEVHTPAEAGEAFEAVRERLVGAFVAWTAMGWIDLPAALNRLGEIGVVAGVPVWHTTVRERGPVAYGQEERHEFTWR